MWITITCGFVILPLHATRAVNWRNVSPLSLIAQACIAIMVLAAPEAGLSSLV